MMKKIVALLLALALLAGVCLAEGAAALPEAEENASLTYEELEIYLSSLVQAAQADPDMRVTKADWGAEVQFAGGSLHVSDENMAEDTVVWFAKLSAEQADPRGLRLGDTLQQILAVYPCDNPDLLGSYYDAALYVNGEKPEVCVGYLLRDGQRVTDAAYTVYHWQEDGVVPVGVTFELDQGVIIGIEIDGPGALLTEEEAQEEIRDISDLQEITDYFAYPQSEYGLDLTPFQREDLAFSGVDFLDLTADSAFAAFGPAASDDWAEDSTGEWLRILTWDGVSLILLYDASRQFLRADSLSVSADVLEGPRGVRVGDYLDTVLFRFRHSEGVMTDVALSLYGDGENPPYGLLTYDVEGAYLSYALALDGGETVLLYFTFVGDALDSMRLLMR